VASVPPARVARARGATGPARRARARAPRRRARAARPPASRAAAGGRRSGAGGAPQWALGAAIVLHGIALFVPMLREDPDIRFGFAQALSAALWLGVSLLWIEGFTVRVDALRLLVLPMAGLAAWLPRSFPAATSAAWPTGRCSCRT
jgi:ABC-type uncharacterized transport system permease subunit